MIHNKKYILWSRKFIYEYNCKKQQYEAQQSPSLQVMTNYEQTLTLSCDGAMTVTAIGTSLSTLILSSH